MLNLEALERALQSIEDTSHVESTFRVGGDAGVLVTLGLLLPAQEVEVQAYAQEALSEDEEGKESNTKDEAMDFLDRWKYGILSYSVQQIGDIDFRGHDYVATGEVTEAGVAIKLEKHVAVRRLIRKLWHRPVLNRVFHKYTELLGDGEAKAEKAIQYKPADLAVEVARRERELAKLKLQLKQQEEGPADPVGQQVKATTGLAATASAVPSTAENISQGENRAARRKKAKKRKKDRKQKTAPAPEPTPQAPSEAPAVRRSAIPTRGAVPPRTAPAPPAPRRAPLDTGSFGDADDDAVMAAETQRLLAARQAAAVAEEGGTNVPGPEHHAQVAAAARMSGRAPGMVPREPPHRQAASTAAAVLDTHGGDITPARPEHVGSINGMEAHRIRPPETLGRRGRGESREQTEAPAMNQMPSGATNPNFKPSR
jgi:hypothetical protein